MQKGPVHHHGVSKAHGCKHVAVSTFSKLFPDLPGLPLSVEDAALLGGPGGLKHDFDGNSPDCAIPAGYAFFAQFVDHDVTLDATTALRGAPLSNEAIAKLPNIRSASLDLDCVYGFGPEASPHIFDPERPGRLAVAENGFDLARSPGGVALIGDPRNDENLFVSQMHLLFHRFHNRIFDERLPPIPGGRAQRFEYAQESARFHYQWLVLFDFLKRLCDPAVYEFAVGKLIAKDAAFPYFYKPAHGHLTMPVEFSVAAYRVGHTLVRSVYAANQDQLDVELFEDAFGALGFSEAPEELVVDWRYLLPVDDCLAPRMCKAVDPLLADELQRLPLPVVPSNSPNDRALAFRNLLRGNSLSLPSGQAVAAELAAHYPGIDTSYQPTVPGRPDLSAQTPLFFYLLAESADRQGGERFGAVGSALILEVFGGMLKYCETSFLHQAERWQPDPCISKERYGWFSDRYREGFDYEALARTPDYYPFDLADVVRFVEAD
ncbi:MAG: peroxidase family protein [Pseudomonadales bacterium]|jgi:hypothetical protein|nr:peroxidase family protein [Pseudomonadales bacterium]